MSTLLTGAALAIACGGDDSQPSDDDGGNGGSSANAGTSGRDRGGSAGRSGSNGEGGEGVGEGGANEAGATSAGGTTGGSGSAGRAGASGNGSGGTMPCGGCADFVADLSAPGQSVGYRIGFGTSGVNLAGATITARIWLRSGGPQGLLQMYVQDVDGGGEYPFVQLSSIPQNDYFDLVTQVPATSNTMDVTRIAQLVFQITAGDSGTFSKTEVWIDSITITQGAQANTVYAFALPPGGTGGLAGNAGASGLGGSTTGGGTGGLAGSAGVGGIGGVAGASGGASGSSGTSGAAGAGGASGGASGSSGTGGLAGTGTGGSAGAGGASGAGGAGGSAGAGGASLPGPFTFDANVEAFIYNGASPADFASFSLTWIP